MSEYDIFHYLLFLEPWQQSFALSVIQKVVITSFFSANNLSALIFFSEVSCSPEKHLHLSGNQCPKMFKSKA